MSKKKRKPKKGKVQQKTKAVSKSKSENKDNNSIIPLRELPLYKFFETEPYRSSWYGLLPELIIIQGEWIERHLALINIPFDAAPYIKNMVSLHQTALLIAGNNRAYFALYSLRAILERVAMAWTIHSTSPLKMTDILTKLRSNDLKVRKEATRSFMNFVETKDPEFATLYDMVSQYFAHASKMDAIALASSSDKEKMLQIRAKSLPLLLLFDVGHRITVFIQGMLKDQGIEFKSAVGGRVSEGFSFSMEKYVRLSTYVNSEKHSQKKGVPFSTLFRGIREIEGEVGITTIYRGGMDLIRFGNPEYRPEAIEIAHFAWYAIGKNHDDKVKVKCVEAKDNGEIYCLSWPKTLELESTSLVSFAAQSKDLSFSMFDYVGEFLNVIEKK